MATPRSDSDDAPPKRMRLGTKSCAECRRRKVRCVFPENAIVCENCTLHEVPCKAQQPQDKEKRKSAKCDEEKEALQRRIDQLEELVRQIAGTVGIDGASPIRAALGPVGVSQSQTTGTEVAGSQLHGFLTPESSSTTGTYGQQQQYSPFFDRQASTASSHLELTDSSDESGDLDADHLDDAPLISLFKDVMSIRKPEGQGQQPSSHLYGDGKMCKPVRNVSHLIPRVEDLEGVLDTTQQYWFSWPATYTGTSPPIPIQAGGPPECLQFISSALIGSNPAVAAKALVWLSLCIFQIPLGSPIRSRLPAAPSKLIDAYITATKELLSDVEERGHTLDSLEALNLLFKLQLDRGRPRKAWLAIRQTLDAALILGLYLPKTPSTSEQEATRRRDLWTSIWTSERHTSLLLGLPASISNDHPGISQDVPDPTDPMMHPKTFLRVIMKLAGSISNRDQLKGSAGYSTTVQLDQEWETVHALMPAPFWTDPPPGLALPQLYFRQMMQVGFNMMGKHIHLPYMFRALTDKKYEPSRQACLQASRDLMRAYYLLRRDLDEKGIVMCETMDFQVFSAAVIVMLDLLARKTREGGMSSVLEDDLLLVEHFVDSLAQTAAVMECSVAEKGSRLLMLLVAVTRGTYTGSRDAVDTHIPYFGRLRITFPQVQPTATVPSPSSSSLLSAPMTSPSVGLASTHAMPEPVNFSNCGIVEFGADPLNFQFPFDFDLNAELSADWSALMEFDPSNYGWTDAFDLDQGGPG